MFPLTVSQMGIALQSRGQKPCWFSKLDVLGDCLSGPGLESWVTLCGVQTLLHRELWVFSSLLIVGGRAGDGVFGEIVSQPVLFDLM